MVDTDFERQNERQMKDEEKVSKALLNGTLMLGSPKTGISVPVLPLMDQETNNRTEAFERKRSGMSNEHPAKDRRSGCVVFGINQNV